MKYLTLCALTLAMLLSLCGCRMSNPMTTTVPTATRPMESQNSVTMETNIPDPSVDTSMPETSHIPENTKGK